MKIVYRVSEQDYMEAHGLFVSNEPRYRRWSRRIMPWEGGVLLIIAIAGLVFTKARALPGFLGLIAAYLFFCGFALRRYFRKLYRTDQRFKHDFTLDISDEGLHSVTPFNESQTKWNAIVRYLESENIFMLFSAPMMFGIIPKRAFAPGEADAFRELLRRNVQRLPEREAKS